MTAKCWTGVEIRCPKCGGDSEYLRDQDHDGGTCEIFRCLKCQWIIHVELPD